MHMNIDVFECITCMSWLQGMMQSLGRVRPALNGSMSKSYINEILTSEVVYLSFFYMLSCLYLVHNQLVDT